MKIKANDIKKKGWFWVYNHDHCKGNIEMGMAVEVFWGGDCFKGRFISGKEINEFSLRDNKDVWIELNSKLLENPIFDPKHIKDGDCCNKCKHFIPDEFWKDIRGNCHNSTIVLANGVNRYGISVGGGFICPNYDKYIET